MKIVHVDFTGPFTEDAAYQENILPAINVLDGHTVTFLAENTRWMDGKVVGLVESEPKDYVLKNGVRIIRMKYKYIINHFVTNKIRTPIGLKEMLHELKPDIIFVHCFQTWSIITICDYVKRNNNVKLFIDSHTDSNNSARGFLSKYILHGILYKSLATYAEKLAEKIFYISPEAKLFLLERYHMDESKLEFMPLGGVIVPDYKKAAFRCLFRQEHGFTEAEILIIHAGKMDKLKRTLEILKFFTSNNKYNIKLILVGTFSDDIRDEALDIVNRDDCIKYLGWKTADELEMCLCASDLYLQPGSQSATAQHALCCGLPVILANVQNYEILVKQNGWLINSIGELGAIFIEIATDPRLLEKMSIASKKIAEDYLDYRSLAKKFTYTS